MNVNNDDVAKEKRNQSVLTKRGRKGMKKRGRKIQKYIEEKWNKKEQKLYGRTHTKLNIDNSSEIKGEVVHTRNIHDFKTKLNK